MLEDLSSAYLGAVEADCRVDLRAPAIMFFYVEGKERLREHHMLGMRPRGPPRVSQQNVM
jgi:hypothetical protein